MATQINQIDDGSNTTLRVEGEIHYDDALLLERIANDIHSETGNRISIDLADLDLLDSDAAPILKRMADFEGFAIEGVEIFLQTIVNDAERQGA